MFLLCDCEHCRRGYKTPERQIFWSLMIYMIAEGIIPNAIN